MDFKIRKAFGGKYILEQRGILPEVYNSFAELITDVFVSAIQKEMTDIELTVHVDIIYNPPTIAPK